MKKIASFLLIYVLFISFNAFATEICDNGISFSNGGTYKHFTGTVTCKDEATGKLTKKVILKDGKRDGTCIYYDKNTGLVQAEENYVNDKKDGVTKKYYPKTGKLQSEMTYSNDRTVGLSKSYYENGKLKYIGNRLEPAKQDTSIRFNNKGQIISISCGPTSIIKDDNIWCGRNGRDGEVFLYDMKGQKIEKRAYLNLVPNGKWIRFHTNGKPAAETNYVNGKLDGKSTSFLENGILEKEIDYKDNSKIQAIEYYQNGSPKVKEVYNLPNRTTAITEYYDNGKPHVEGIYRYNRKEDSFYFQSFSYSPVGLIKEYYEDGILAKESLYNDKSVLVSKKEYSKKGELISDEDYFPDGSRKAKRL